MTLQIATPGTFTTPGLPNLSVVGFSDTFGRGNSGSLGYTERPKRAWMLEPNDPASLTGGVVSGQGYIKRTASAGPGYAMAESYAADCTISITLSTLATGWQREFGLMFRYESANNMWRFYSRDGSEYRLAKYVNGSTTIIWTSTGITPTSGDVLSAVLNGSSVAVSINGVQVHSLTDSHCATATVHGWYGNSIEDTDRVDNISVVPLG